MPNAPAASDAWFAARATRKSSSEPGGIDPRGSTRLGVAEASSSSDAGGRERDAGGKEPPGTDVQIPVPVPIPRFPKSPSDAGGSSPFSTSVSPRADPSSPPPRDFSPRRARYPLTPSSPRSSRRISARVSPGATPAARSLSAASSTLRLASRLSRGPAPTVSAAVLVLAGGAGARGAGRPSAAARASSSSHTGTSDCTTLASDGADASGVRITSSGFRRWSTSASASSSTLADRGGGDASSPREETRRRRAPSTEPSTEPSTDSVGSSSRRRTRVHSLGTVRAVQIFADRARAPVEAATPATPIVARASPAIAPPDVAGVAGVASVAASSAPNPDPGTNTIPKFPSEVLDGGTSSYSSSTGGGLAAPAVLGARLAATRARWSPGHRGMGARNVTREHRASPMPWRLKSIITCMMNDTWASYGWKIRLRMPPLSIAARARVIVPGSYRRRRAKRRSSGWYP